MLFTQTVMAKSVYYHVAGAANCPYFARAKRLAQLLSSQLNFTDDEIRIESVDPAQWDTFYATTSKVRKMIYADFVYGACVHLSLHCLLL